MSDFKLVDETLDFNLTLTYSLSIQIALDGFSFCVFDPVRDKFIALYHKSINRLDSIEEYCASIEKFVNTETIFTRKFKKVKVLYNSDNFSFVPTPFYDKSNNEKYLSLTSDVKSSEKLFTNILSNVDAVCVYTIEDKVIDTCLELFPNSRFYHQSVPAIETSLVTYKNKTKIHKVIVDVSSQKIDLLVVKGRKLILFNSFNYKSDEDFSYFILLIYEQLKLSAEETELIFMGEIDKKDSTFTLIKKYIRHIKFEKFDDSFLYSYTLFDIPSYKFSNLFSLQKCE